MQKTDEPVNLALQDSVTASSIHTHGLSHTRKCVLGEAAAGQLIVASGLEACASPAVQSTANTVIPTFTGMCSLKKLHFKHASRTLKVVSTISTTVEWATGKLCHTADCWLELN